MQVRTKGPAPVLHESKICEFDKGIGCGESRAVESVSARVPQAWPCDVHVTFRGLRSEFYEFVGGVGVG